jgi:hypothetical protein
MLRRALEKTLVHYLAALWLVAVGTGMALLSAYASTPGIPASAPPTWPAASMIARRIGAPTVLVFAHLQCPCTRATLGEIDWLLARVHGRADVHVLFSAADDPEEQWEDTSLAQLAASIPSVRVHRDAGGREAARFGVATSGEVLLYDAGDHLRFAGGITGARGHAGGNPGRDRLLEQLTAARGDGTPSPVFGCALGIPPTT